MNTVDRPRDTPNEFIAPASNMTDRARLLALADEEYYRNGQLPRGNRWQHPLQRTIQAKRSEARRNPAVSFLDRPRRREAAAGIGVIGLLGWRRKRKAQAVA
jgi:hypothetical protein